MVSTHASILIVDDEELNRDLLSRKLQDEGHVITACSTGNEALELTSLEKFDLILLDIMLPDINGDKILKIIKKNHKLESTPIMMITANSDREMVLKCIEAGAADYLVKPYAMPIVKSRIWRCLKNSLNETQISRHETKPDNARILLVEDQELNRVLLADRLRKSGYIITCVNDGLAALKILRKEKFDLILLDIIMPDISGLDVLRQIRAAERCNDIPVIMVTAMDDAETINLCMQAGADDYIMKPFNTTLLKMRVASCIQFRL